MSDLVLVFDESGISQMFGGIDNNGAPYDFYVRRVERHTYFGVETPTNERERDYAYVLVNARGDMLTGGLTLEGITSAVRGRSNADNPQEWASR